MPGHSGSPSALLGFERLVPEDVPRAVELLCRAFDRDPLVDWVVRSDARRAEGMRRFFGVCLRQLTMPFGEVWTTPDFSAVSLWTPPDAFRLGLAEQMHFLGEAVPGMQLRHVPSRLIGFNDLERRHPKERHYYLFFLGVDPDRQGEGIGSSMMAAMLARCDAEGVPAYLEATRDELVRFYRGFGYETRFPMRLRFGGPDLYPMWRPPRTPAASKPPADRATATRG